MKPSQTDTAPTAPTTPEKPSLKERMKRLMEEYGPVAFAIYFGIFFLVWGAFAVAIKMGFELDGAGGTAGTLGASYLATKATQPLRILATLALTPPIGRFWLRRKKPQT
ncbi:hypothetical protein P2318_01965 [Myxococcaceae bacterium GXIMD 01537]